MSLPDPGEVGFEQIVADQGQEPPAEFAMAADDLAHRRREIVVHASPYYSAQIGKRPHVAVEKGELIAALVQPGELAPRVHQPQQELPRLAPFATDFHHHLKKIDLRFARTMNQRHVNLGALPAPLAPIITHQRPAHSIAFRPQLPMKAHRGDALLARRSRLPLRHQLLQTRLHRFPHRPPTLTPRTSNQFGLIQILGYGVAA
jgi:hypothetical protein